MHIVDSNDAVRAWVAQERAAGKRIAFVPTMGNLHAGHLALVRRGFSLADRVIVSIFVNPLQFGANEDFANYPRTFDEDRRRLTQVGASCLFFPDEKQLYPHGREASTRVIVPGISNILCGASRPGHFEGVATVVAKFFNIVAPDVAIFGEKDFQQVMVIRQMARDLFMPLHIVSEPTVRETDGLAMSSRNGYLSPDERAQAPVLYREIRKVADAVLAGSRDYERLLAQAASTIQQGGFITDYLTLRNTDTLQEATDETPDKLVVLVAAKLGRTRLIDNIRVVRS